MEVKGYLSELADIADPFALQGPEVLGDSAVLEIHQTGERLVEKRANRMDREVTSFRLGGLVSLLPGEQVKETAYSQSMDHGFEAHIDLSTADDLGHVGRVIGLQ